MAGMPPSRVTMTTDSKSQSIRRRRPCLAASVWHYGKRHWRRRQQPGFQKLLFLYCQEIRLDPIRICSIQMGTFSFTSYADRRKLVERGLLEDDDRNWKITAAGRASVAAQSKRIFHRSRREPPAYAVTT